MLLFVILTSAFAPPPPADVNCITGRIPASLRAEIIRESQSGQGGPVREQIRQATFACAREGEWAATRLERAGIYAAALMLVQEHETVLRRLGIAPELIQRWLDTNARGVAASQVTEEMAGRLLASLRSAGVPARLIDDNPDQIGGYIAARLTQAQVEAAD